MEQQNSSLKIEFKYSGEKKLVTLASLIEKTVTFLENYGEPSLVGEKFYKIIGPGDGPSRWKKLLKVSGCEDDPKSFFLQFIDIIEKTNSNQVYSVRINTVELPRLLSLALLEVIIPGYKFIVIKSTGQLQRLTNIRIPEEERADLEKVLKTYPVRLSMHTIRQMRISEAVAYQFMPFTDELNDEGHTHTWVGQFHRGIVEQMYRNRIIFVLNMSCPVYCRFCFRKHKECRNQKAPTQDHVKNAVSYVRNSPQIQEIVLTGGDPFMNRATLTLAVDLLSTIPHVQTLRIATRSISYYPHLFYVNNDFWLNYLKRKQLEVEARNKRIEIATHFIHPDEISLESLDIITELCSSGIPVYVQTPLLKDCNDEGPEVVELYRKLREAGAEMHYIYIVCSPIKGNRRYVAPVSSGIQLQSYLRANLTDRAMPRICTATKIGKIDWNTSGWAVEPVRDDPGNIWIRTPYTEDYFREFSPILHLSEFARVNSEGTLDVKFMADIGDDSLFWGSREAISQDGIFPPEQELAVNEERVSEALKQLQEQAMEDQRFRQSVVSTNSSTLFRTHKTRVEFDLDADEREIKQNIKYIRDHRAISDVVFSARNDIIDSLYKLSRILKSLEDVYHVTAYRLRSHKFNYVPHQYTRSLIKKLASFNNLAVVNSRRVEIETQFLHASEITPEHGSIVNQLRNHGITVYNNSPLLPFINDSAGEISQICAKCRENSIEFHHLYIAGLPIQQKWEREYPVDISSIINIATYIRRFESGRSIPRLIIRTVLGELDFGLTSRIHGIDDEGRVLITALPYNLKYFRDMDPDYQWPEGLTFDEQQHPCVRVPGLKKTPEFLVDRTL
jgi:KamA family protein